MAYGNLEQFEILNPPQAKSTHKVLSFELSYKNVEFFLEYLNLNIHSLYHIGDTIGKCSLHMRQARSYIGQYNIILIILKHTGAERVSRLVSDRHCHMPSPQPLTAIRLCQRSSVSYPMWPSGRRLPATRGPTAGAHGALTAGWHPPLGLHAAHYVGRVTAAEWGGKSQGGGYIAAHRCYVSVGEEGRVVKLSA